MKTSLFEVLDHLMKRSSNWSQFSLVCCTFIFMINHDQEPGTFLSQLWFQFFLALIFIFHNPHLWSLVPSFKLPQHAARCSWLVTGVKVEGKVKKDLLYVPDRPDQDDVQRYSRSILQSLSFLCMWDDPPTIPIPIPIPNHSYFPGTPSTFLLLT